MTSRNVVYVLVYVTYGVCVQKAAVECVAINFPSHLKIKMCPCFNGIVVHRIALPMALYVTHVKDDIRLCVCILTMNARPRKGKATTFARLIRPLRSGFRFFGISSHTHICRKVIFHVIPQVSFLGGDECVSMECVCGWWWVPMRWEAVYIRYSKGLEGLLEFRLVLILWQTWLLGPRDFLSVFFVIKIPFCRKECGYLKDARMYYAKGLDKLSNISPLIVNRAILLKGTIYILIVTVIIITFLYNGCRSITQSHM